MTQQVFEDSVREYRRALHCAAYKIVKSRVDAEEIVQTALMKGYIHLDTFEGRSKPTSWLYRIALNEAKMFVRKRSRREPYHGTLANEPEASDTTNPDSMLFRTEFQQAFDAAVDALPAAQREAALLKFGLGLTNKEMVIATGKNITAVKTAAHHATRKLRESLAAYR